MENSSLFTANIPNSLVTLTKATIVVLNMHCKVLWYVKKPSNVGQFNCSYLKKALAWRVLTIYLGKKNDAYSAIIVADLRIVNV